MTEKYNSYLNRYEYFDSSGNLTGYKTYNSYLGVWEYFNENTNTYNKKPIQYAKPPTDDNFALLQQVANQKQNSYNSNHKRIGEYLEKIKINIFEIENLEIRAKTLKRYDSEIVDVINNKGYDLSSNALTQQVLDFIYNKFNAIKAEEFKKYNDEIENNNKLSETEINTSVGENAFPYNLEKYLGDHTVYKIEDYTRTSDGKWTIANIENSIAGVFLFKNQIHFKRNNSQLVGVRLFSYKKFSSGFYIFSSNNGETYIDKDFKKIIFFDMNDVNKKHIYYVM
jgi:hypothetical protein